MGLLDQFGNLDPEQTQGLLAAAAQMLQQSGPSTRPMGIGQIFGGGLQAYQGGLDHARQRQMELAQQAQMGQLRGLQIQEAQGGLSDHQRARDEADRLRQFYTERNTGGAPAQPAAQPQGGAQGMLPVQIPSVIRQPGPEWLQAYQAQNGAAPTLPQAKPQFQAPQEDDPYQQRMTLADQLRARGFHAQADAMEEKALKFKPDFDQTPRVGIGADGKPVTYVLDKFGRKKVLDVLPRDEMKLENLGGTTVAYNPYALQVGQTFKRTQSPDSVASNGVTIRGQNMTDALAREANANASGNKAPTEFQGKSAAYGLRASEADKILNGLAGKYNPAAINSKTQVEDWPIIGGIAGGVANMALSDKDQQAEQAQRDFVNAILRQESGAAIGAPEFSNAKKQYFPQPGDSAAVITQKARNRQLAIQGLETNAGRARMTAPPDAAGGSGWKIERAD